MVLPPITLVRATRVPVYRQLADQFAVAIRRGALDGARLPSTRVLATLLGVSRNTVLAAYDELVAAGLVKTRPGSGSHVADSGSPEQFAPLRVFRDAQYPARTISIRDPDGGCLYLAY